MLGSWLEDLAAEQAELGGVPMVVPDVLGGPNAPTALWGDVAVSLPVALHEAYGDEAILERQYPSMAAFIDQVDALLDEHGVWSTGFQFGDWVDPDAPPGNPGGGKADRHLIATAFLARTTGELADAAELLGRADDAARYRALHDRVRAGFRQEWVTPSGLVADLSATAYALAICFGLLDPEQEPKAGAQLAKLVKKAEHRISTGFAGTPYVTEALSRTGHLDTAYALLLETGCPSFLYPLSDGRDDDLGALGRHPARRHAQPHRHDLAQPLRPRRCRRLAPPRRRRPGARRARLPDDAGRAAARRSGSPTPRPRTTPRTAGPGSAGSTRPTARSSSR